MIIKWDSMHTVLRANFTRHTWLSSCPLDNLIQGFGVKFYRPDALPGANQQKHTGLCFSESTMTPEGVHLFIMHWLSDANAPIIRCESGDVKYQFIFCLCVCLEHSGDTVSDLKTSVTRLSSCVNDTGVYSVCRGHWKQFVVAASLERLTHHCRHSKLIALT